MKINIGLRQSFHAGGAWACLLTAVMLAPAAPSLRAQGLVGKFARQPFMMTMGGPGLPTTYTVPNYYGSHYASDSNYLVGTNLVIKQISVIYAGPIGSSLYVQMTTCYDWGAATGSNAGTRLCPSVNYQTPAMNSSAPYVIASFPLTTNVPNAIAYPAPQVSFNFCQYPSGTCSSSPPASASITVAGYFEAF